MVDSTDFSSGSPSRRGGDAPHAGQTIGLASARRPARRTSRALRAWWRRHFSREQLASGFRTMLWVVPLTVFIWIWAERETPYTPAPVTIPIDVSSNDPNCVVTLRRPEQPLIMATLSGPKAQVEAVIRNLDPQYGAPLRIEVDRSLGLGNHLVDLSRINNDPRFAAHGVTVSAPQPALLDVYVDPIVEEPVKVVEQARLPDVSSVTFTPPTVEIRGPRTVLEAARAAGKLKLMVNLSSSPEFTAAVANPPDHPLTLDNIHLTLDFEGHDVSIVGPAVVRAEVRFTAAKEFTIPYVPVEVVASSQVLNDYRVDYENNKTLTNVIVTGPEEQIEQLSRMYDPGSTIDPSQRPRATFEVTPDDTGGPKTKTVDFKLPQGITYKSGPNSVNFQLIQRHGTE